MKLQYTYSKKARLDWYYEKTCSAFVSPNPGPETISRQVENGFLMIEITMILFLSSFSLIVSERLSDDWYFIETVIIQIKSDLSDSASAQIKISKSNNYDVDFFSWICIGETRHFLKTTIHLFSIFFTFTMKWREGNHRCCRISRWFPIISKPYPS